MKKKWTFDKYTIDAKTNSKIKSNYNISLAVFYGGSLICGSFEKEDSTEEYLLREGLRMIDALKEEVI